MQTDLPGEDEEFAHSSYMEAFFAINTLPFSSAIIPAQQVND
ncbi:hypothetical protein SNE25_19655 [Mucilaginibacter sabulilitoris]|uniref:Uncharacterized protein n=1 Tax=Mucilaginibacter sabulilitoris TaxID=1173583 RepID=A0ABZ0TH62_9SPHI|nr:hypothetical protein [Mucilaginibacter sabulilitoris]WPU91538.1 hypothetical protein SNE25_19655 [Mucilaginibacter sabulilitoris]